jgi:hypothetical protein
MLRLPYQSSHIFLSNLEWRRAVKHFLITQYASGKNTKNEPFVANSITIPPNSIKKYYNYFDIEKYQDYIETTLEKYTKFSSPKLLAKTEKLGGKHYRFNKTRKNKNK